MSKVLLYKRMNKYLVINLNYFHSTLAIFYQYVIFVLSKRSGQLQTNIEGDKMIIGNLQFEFVLVGLVVKSATCLETGRVYSYEKSNELFRKSQVYL